MKKIVISLVFILAVAFVPASSRAESSLEVVLYDSIVGAGIGALAGAATLAFMDHPGDHLTRRVSQGAAIGLLCGIGFGIYEIRPVLYTDVDHEGNKDRVYGLTFFMPLK